MKLDSARSAASVSTSTNAVNASIQNSTVNSEPNALSGRCQGTDGKEKSIGRRGESVEKIRFKAFSKKEKSVVPGASFLPRIVFRRPVLNCGLPLSAPS